MEILLKNIGYILDNAPTDEVKAYARTLLRRVSDGEKNVCGFYLELVARYLNSMDPGADWTALEILSEATKDWLVFNKKYVGEDIYLENNKVDNTRPDFFELKRTPLFLESEDYDE